MQIKLNREKIIARWLRDAEKDESVRRLLVKWYQMLAELKPSPTITPDPSESPKSETSE